MKQSINRFILSWSIYLCNPFSHSAIQPFSYSVSNRISETCFLMLNDFVKSKCSIRKGFVRTVSENLQITWRQPLFFVPSDWKTPDNWGFCLKATRALRRTKWTSTLLSTVIFQNNYVHIYFESTSSRLNLKKWKQNTQMLHFVSLCLSFRQCSLSSHGWRSFRERKTVYTCLITLWTHYPDISLLTVNQQSVCILFGKLYFTHV